MGDRPYYVVACINQASGQIEDTLASQVLHFNEEDALWERDLHTVEAEEAGRRDRYIVCEVTPADEACDVTATSGSENRP